MKAELIFRNNLLVLEDFQYDKRLRYEWPEYEDMRVAVRVVSGAFAGVATFECNFEDITRLCSKLEEIHAFRATEAYLSDYSCGSELCITMGKTGQMKIHGELKDINSLQYLQFSFFADQTVLLSFIHDLKRIIDKLME